MSEMFRFLLSPRDEGKRRYREKMANIWSKIWCYQCGNVGEVVREWPDRTDMKCPRCRIEWTVKKQ